MDLSTTEIVGGVIAAAGGGGGITGLIAWSFRRNFAMFEATVTDNSKGVAENSQRITELEKRMNERFAGASQRALEDTMKQQTHNTAIGVELRHLTEAISEIKTILAGMKHSVETTRDKQSDFYQRALRDVEDRISERLKKLEGKRSR